MTSRSDIQSNRQQVRGWKAFWVLLTVAMALVVIGAARGSERDRGDSRHAGHRHAGHGQANHEHGELSAQRIEEFLAADSRWLQRAGIEEEQRQQIAGLLRSSLPEFAAMKDDRAALVEGLTEALGGDEPDIERIEELRWEAAELSTRALDESFDVMVGLAEVLTSEQRLELIEHWQERR